MCSRAVCKWTRVCPYKCARVIYVCGIVKNVNLVADYFAQVCVYICLYVLYVCACLMCVGLQTEYVDLCFAQVGKNHP